ncbi:hypothetical protein AB3Y40_10275 [Yoonia sp. R2331]|uniref:hypothetical protein n=1 Tax=Yoonia sp. R2331 TaxID=3237238 RepID=UPI0034E5AFE2
MPDECDKTLHLYRDTPRGVCLVSFFDQGDRFVVEGGGTGQTRSRATFGKDEARDVEAAIEALLADGYAPISADQVSGIKGPSDNVGRRSDGRSPWRSGRFWDVREDIGLYWSGDRFL